MTTSADAIHAPSRAMMLLEGRAPWELVAFLAAAPLLCAAPRGDGHSVLVLPGLLTDDSSTRPLRSFLANRGYAPANSGRLVLRWLPESAPDRSKPSP